MSGERKKATLKPITKLEPKKRDSLPEKPKEVVKKVLEVKKAEPIITVEEPKEVKQRAKPSENKYIRLAIDAKGEERKVFSDKVKNGEIKLAHYATDGDKGYHYYLVFKK